MARTLIIQKIDDEKLWNDFVTESPQGSIFSRSDWIKATAAVQGGKPCFLGVLDDKRLDAGLAFVELSHGPFSKMTTPVLTPYGGVMYRRGTGKRVSEHESYNMACADKLIAYINDRYNYAFLAHSPGFSDLRPFTWAGWNESVRYTYEIDLTDTDKIWDVMERRVRTVIRNAESTLELTNSIGLEQFGSLYERIYLDRKIKPPVSSSMVKVLLGKALDSGIAEIRTVVDKSGDILSSMALVSDEKTVYSWISGSLPDKNSSGAFTLLFWDAIKRYSATHTTFDMVGANIPSIAFFKKGFGGTLKPYYVTERYSSWLIQKIFKAYGRLRKVTRT